jgi:NAD(P)-dependent dehydrogenase (short-subunit alcohol dehydrogenase family)
MSKGVAVVTGGSRGIGAAACARLAADGYDVVVNYAGNEAAAAGVVKAVEAEGRSAIAVQGDMAALADIERLFEEAAAFGQIVAVVNNAGITGAISRLDEASEETIRKVVDLNVTGAILVAREAVKRLSTKHGGPGGAIVNLSSAAVWLGAPGEFTWYAASKGAIDSFTIGLAKEVAQEGIRVNAIAPGLIDTDIHATAGNPERVKKLGHMIPLGRAGTAEDCAKVISWLISEESAYTIGEIVKVTGGR